MEKEYTKFVGESYADFFESIDIYLDWFFNYQSRIKELASKYNITEPTARLVIKVGAKKHIRQVESGQRNETVGYGNKIIKEI